MSESTEILIKQLEVVKRMLKNEHKNLGVAVIDQAIKKLSQQ